MCVVGGWVLHKEIMKKRNTKFRLFIDFLWREEEVIQGGFNSAGNVVLFL